MVSSQLELSTQILIKEAQERGYEVDILDVRDNFIRLRKANHIEYVKQATRTSLDNYIAPLIMENKEVTKIILTEHGINVPQGVAIQSIDEALLYYEQFNGQDIVIKPRSTNFGIGITMLKAMASKKVFIDALRFAFEHDAVVLIETFIPGREYRFLVIGDETVAVLYREPANVVGDGHSTIRQLVAEKNRDPLRGEGYVKPLEKIKIGEVEQDYLLTQSLTPESIVEEGRTVYLRNNSNISTGGDSIDTTDEIPEFYKQIAVQAAQAVGARMCGADIIINNLNTVPTKDSYSVIELNFNPALHIHNYPFHGINRRVEKKVLDLLEQQYKTQRH